MAIATGAILPGGADAVLKIEDSEVRKISFMESLSINGIMYSGKDRIIMRVTGYSRKITA